MVFVFTGCAAQQGKTESKPAEEVKTVYIGFSGPLSGGSAKYGQNCLDGMNMAIDEINAKGLTVGGQKYKLEVVSLDDKYKANEAATNARRLVQQYKTPVVFNPHSGGISAISQFNEQEGFILAGYTSDPSVENRGNKLLIRIPTPFTWYLVKDGFVDQAMARFGKRVVAVPGVHEYAKNWTKIFIEEWEKAGGQVLGNFPVDYTTEADFYTPVSKALATKPDVMFIGGPSEPTGLIIKQARELGFKGGFIAMDQAKENEIERFLPMEMLEGFIGTGAVQDYATTSEYAQKVGKTNKGAVVFLEKWKQRYGDKEPTSEASYHYMMPFIFAKAMELAGTVTDAKAIYAKLPAAIQAIPDEQMTRVIEGITDTGGLINVTLGTHVKNGKREPFVMLAPPEYKSRKLPTN
ncbi:hypothetical protein SY88_15625 [Clostridiales bacterium PH28_bin88]|nr:hypothetical protein SY88_15625 [Clostridiales bacterium PH28_bin88]